ncbi:hypothetical protein [Sulfurisphaera tokodaii]|uniref:Uncharacterized protein n=2 Tax=Sulfurisphaera tokodaii TaxID=111955 RepID=Q96ZD1_SULTO|nr:hypothetical protein [Sulfurisphaera tokodaii]BAB66994.1 hypothetical protein STK_19000 [Sulfurisphaera tokodaii str. 7]HII75352.1 hypothetical protein [Sulfurisphaera tokodaii]
MMVEEELLKPGENELKEMQPYIFNLIDQLNNILVQNEDLLTQNGLARRISVTLSIMTLHRYNPDIFMKEVWDDVLQIVEELKKIPQVANQLNDLLADIEKLNELKKQAGI